jgi:hypothetical protein
VEEEVENESVPLAVGTKVQVGIVQFYSHLMLRFGLWAKAVELRSTILVELNLMCMATYTV